tara:strand:+ start:45 stop:581 length:537 start_codon:yes stop_codon:yes gene_type:complete
MLGLGNSLSSSSFIGGAAVLVYESDFSSGLDGWFSSSLGTVAVVAGDQDNVSDDNSVVRNDVLKLSRTTDTDIAAFWAAKNLYSIIGNAHSTSDKYFATVEYLSPSSNSSSIGIDKVRFGTASDTSVTSDETGSWLQVETALTSFTLNSFLYIFADDPLASDDDDVFYISKVKVYKIS